MFRAGASGINTKATIQLRAWEKSRWQICPIICFWFRWQNSSLRLNFPRRRKCACAAHGRYNPLIIMLSLPAAG